MFSRTESSSSRPISLSLLCIFTVYQRKGPGTNLLMLLRLPAIPGWFSALVAARVSFEDGLSLVRIRGFSDAEGLCSESWNYGCGCRPDRWTNRRGVCRNYRCKIIPANYNCPGQLVISGAFEESKSPEERLTAAGAKKVITLPGWRSLSFAANGTCKELSWQKPSKQSIFISHFFPIYQNVDASSPGSVRN